MHDLAKREAGRQFFQRHSHPGNVSENGCIRHDRNIIFRKVNPRLELRDERYQILLDRLQPFRKRAFQLLSRDFRLKQALRFDQIPHRLSLRQIDAPIQESPHRELARLGQPCPPRDRQLHNMS